MCDNAVRVGLVIVVISRQTSLHSENMGSVVFFFLCRNAGCYSPPYRIHPPYTYDVSRCFFPKFKKPTKRGSSRQKTYCFGSYGPKIGGGVLLPGFCPKISKTPKFGLFPGICACSGLVLQNSAAHQCTCL